MSLIRDLFSANFTLTDPERLALRTSLKKWGAWFGFLTVAVLVLVGIQDPSPDRGLVFDVAQKAAFGLMRLVLAAVGWFLGAFLGYVAYQMLEATKAGSNTTRIDGSETEPVKTAKLLNRGILLAVMCGLGALVMALALSGAGGR